MHTLVLVLIALLALPKPHHSAPVPVPTPSPAPVIPIVINPSEYSMQQFIYEVDDKAVTLGQLNAALPSCRKTNITTISPDDKDTIGITVVDCIR